MSLRGSLGGHAANALVPALVHFAASSRKLAGTKCDDVPAEEESAPIDPGGLIAAVLLLCLSGLFSGLNLRLMSAAADNLKVIIEGSTDADEVRLAKKILPLCSTGNLLLCTLLLGNTLVNALIAILLADMTSGTIGAIATTVLIVLFGEIGPQAVCSRYSLQIGAAATPVVWMFVVLMFPFAYPISKVLDYLLGGEVAAAYQRSELVSLIKLNVEDAAHAKESGLTANDGKLLTGALIYKEKLVHETMTPMAQVFSLSDDALLDWNTIELMLTRGHSRVPVFKSDDNRIYVGVLFLKDIVGLGFERKTPVREVLHVFDSSKRLHYVSKNEKLGNAFTFIKDSRINLLLVTEDDNDSSKKGTPMDNGPPMVVGVLTTEDILEEILQEELLDEHDLDPTSMLQSSKNGVKKRNLTKRYDPATYIRALDPSKFMKRNTVQNVAIESKEPEMRSAEATPSSAPPSVKKSKAKKKANE